MLESLKILAMDVGFDKCGVVFTIIVHCLALVLLAIIRPFLLSVFDVE